MVAFFAASVGGVDGVTITRAIRRETHLKEVPILMLTARREESDKVNGLESGAEVSTLPAA